MKSNNQTTKKSRTRKSSISDNTASDASEERKENVNKQTAQENSTPSKTSRENKNEALREAKNCEREGSGARDKIQRKSNRVKAVARDKIQRKSNRVKAVTRDKETVKVPFSTSKQDWTQSGSDTANKSINQDLEQNYENEALKTNRKMSANDAKRKNKSRSPPREKNTSIKKEEEMVPLEAGGKKSSQYARNNYNPPRQQEERNSRNESSDINRHDFNARSRSPINFDSEKNDLHNKPQTDKARYKRSPKTDVLKKHRSNSRSRQASEMGNESQEFQTEDKGSSVLTNEDSKVSRSKDPEKDPPQKQNSVQTSTKPTSETSRTHQNYSSSAKNKKIGVKSLELRQKTPNFQENSSKVSKRSKTKRWMKMQRNDKEVVSGRKQNGKDTLAKDGQNRRKTKKKSTTRKK